MTSFNPLVVIDISVLDLGSSSDKEKKERKKKLNDQQLIFSTRQLKNFLALKWWRTLETQKLFQPDKDDKHFVMMN